MTCFQLDINELSECRRRMRQEDSANELNARCCATDCDKAAGRWDDRYDALDRASHPAPATRSRIVNPKHCQLRPAATRFLSNRFRDDTRTTPCSSILDWTDLHKLSLFSRSKRRTDLEGFLIGKHRLAGSLLSRTDGCLSKRSREPADSGA